MSKQCRYNDIVGDRCPYDVRLERIAGAKSERVVDEDGNYMCHIYPLKPASHGLCYYHYQVILAKTIEDWRAVYNYEKRFGKAFYKS